MGLWFLCVALSVAAFIFLFVDTYPAVKSFRASISTGSFWLLWIIFSVLNLVAFGAVKVAAGEKIKGWVGAEFTDLALVLLATLGTVGIMQSLTVKVADYKFIDLGSLIEGFRGRVLRDMAKKSADQQRLFAMKVADRLAEKYKNNSQGLRDEYSKVMSFGGRTIPQIGKELSDLQSQTTASNLSFERAVAARIAQTDIELAKQLLKS